MPARPGPFEKSPLMRRPSPGRSKNHPSCAGPARPVGKTTSHLPGRLLVSGQAGPVQTSSLSWRYKYDYDTKTMYLESNCENFQAQLKCICQNFLQWETSSVEFFKGKIIATVENSYLSLSLGIWKLKRLRISVKRNNYFNFHTVIVWKHQSLREKTFPALKNAKIMIISWYLKCNIV